MQFKALILALVATLTVSAAPLAEPAAEAIAEPYPEAIAEAFPEDNTIEARQFADCRTICRAGADALIAQICPRFPTRVGPVPARAACQGIARAVGSRPGQGACNFACDAIQNIPFN